MRVAINMDQLLVPSPGGVGRYAAKLGAHLTALGVEVVPVVAWHKRSRTAAAWASLAEKGLPPPRSLPLPRPLLHDAWRLLSWPPLVPPGQAVDVVHAPSLAVPPRPKAGYLVVTVHDAGPWRYPEGFTSRGRRFHQSGLKSALRHADALLTGSQAAADELQELAGVPSGRLLVVPYGVDQPAERPGPEAVSAVRHRLGLGERPYVLWVGSLEPRKGVGTLVAAMARLAAGRSVTGEQPRTEEQPRTGERVGTGEGARHAAAALVLAGYQGWQNAGLISPEDEAVLGPSLVRAGRVSETDLAALYRGASVFALPSWHEGFGLPVLEAMAEGLPVVASDIPAIREVAGGAAQLVPVGDVEAWAGTLEALLGSTSQRSALAEAGRRRSLAFSWRATAEATLAVYRQLMG